MANWAMPVNTGVTANTAVQRIIACLNIAHPFYIEIII
jgi:hypothetical protein